MSDSLLPRADDVLAAAARIAPHASVTPVLRSRTLDALGRRAAGVQGRNTCSAAAHSSSAGPATRCGRWMPITPVPAWSPIRPATTALPWPGRAHRAFPATWWCPKVRWRPSWPTSPATVPRSGAARRPSPTARPPAPKYRLIPARPGSIPMRTGGDGRQGTAALELLHSDGPFDVLVVPVGGGGAWPAVPPGPCSSPVPRPGWCWPNRPVPTTPRARWPQASARARSP